MRLRDILIDPDFAGLHWSIPPNAPAEVRESLHVNAALRARLERNRKRHVFHPQALVCTLCNQTAADVHLNLLECPDPPKGADDPEVNL